MSTIKLNINQKPVEKQQPVQDENGDWYYNNQPANTRVAGLNDFYRDGRLLKNKPYLVHSMLSPGKYWAFRVREGFEQRNSFMEFLKLGRVFVFE